MSLELKTVRAAIWSISSSIATRVVGLVGTLVLTRYLAEDVYGEVSVAQVVVLTVNTLSSFGLANYIVVHSDVPRSTTFHATFYYLAFGAVGLALAVLLRGPLGPLVNAPAMGLFLPGLALAALFDRIGFVPERILVRELRFRVVSIEKSLGELLYTGVSVGLAAYGWGGTAIVMGSLARSAVRMVICLAAANRATWCTPSSITRAETRQVFAFGVPLSMASWAHMASANWDNLLISRFFGTSVVGVYNFAYRLADIPATHVGEQIGDVLLPSFALMTDEQRKAALPRAFRLVALIVFPLALGLGALSHALVSALLAPRWGAVAPMLQVLSALSVVRPIGWIVNSYLQAYKRTKPILVLEFAKVIALLAILGTLGRLSPLWACAAVGVTFAVHAIVATVFICLKDGLSVRSLLLPLGPPLLACGPMVATVLGAHALLGDGGTAHRILRLVLELVVGAVVYVPSALLIAPSSSKELIRLGKSALRRRRQKGDEQPEDAQPPRSGPRPGPDAATGT